MDKTYFVYILASKRNGTLYVGMTNNLERRITEHKEQIKIWKREWKINLIEKDNPNWKDLY
ncbi:MAG: hypothetical protein UR28_C0013G0020 [Candidatus Peregrinibacteria bacterium GW2011_GWF2_33_10]|nr:MAG: hypothetical protein UR28_C0013G0020 [Candidatus Peregrinibacteria bacterium GW2011_GWF2_33_10]